MERAQHRQQAPADDIGVDLADYRALFEALPTPSLIITPPDFVMAAANAARCEATNTRREDVIGRRLFDVFPDNPDDPAATGEANLRASLGRVLATGRTDVMPVQKYDIRRPDGGFEERWWAPVNIPIRDDRGSVRHILHQVDDVTAEMRQRRRAEDAEARAARVREVADAVPGLVFEIDDQVRNTYVNEQFQRFTGLPFEALLGYGWRRVVHPDEQEGAAAAMRDVLRTGQHYDFEGRLRRADGAWRWVLIRASRLPARGDQPVRGIGVCIDITSQREAMELQRTLLQEVSHRVKNSLALVSSMINLQARNQEGPARRTLEEASLRVHTVAQVHDQLWRGASARHIQLERFLCDLCQAIGKTAPRIATRCDAAPATVSADMAVPIGLFVNELLTNAYKYAYPDGEAGEVRVSGTRPAEDRYRLEVADGGRGLPPEFDLRRSGESLGMKVVTSLAAQLQGDLDAGPATPGARFTLDFPLKPP